MFITRPATEIVRRVPVRRLLIVTPLVVIAMGAAVMGARARVSDSEIAAGVHVSDLDLGGKSVDVARPLLEQWAAHKQSLPVSLRCTPDSGVTRTWKPDPAKLGLSVNVESTLEAANRAGRENLAGQVKSLFAGVKPVQVAPIATVDNTRLSAYLKRQVAADLVRKPKNAKFVLIPGGGFGTHHELPGLALDIEASAAAVKQSWTTYVNSNQPSQISSAGHTDISHSGDDAGAATPESGVGAPDHSATSRASNGPEAELVVKTTPAPITSADLDQINKVLGAKSSYVNGTVARLGNIRIAASHINGTLLKPGDVFSYNKIVGPRDEDEGYREAPILVRGKHDKGIAGGICQTSGTLFNAVLRSGLQIVEREHHSTPIGYLPIGLDATVSYGSLDLKFKNNTEAPVYVAATLNGRTLSFSLFGKEVPGREVALVRGGFSRTGAPFKTLPDRTKRVGYRRIVERGASGAHVTWFRIIKENGKVVHRDVISSHYSPQAGVVVVGTGVPKARPVKPSATGPGANPGVSPGVGGPAPPGAPAGTP